MSAELLMEPEVLEAVVPPEEWVPGALEDLDRVTKNMLKLAARSNKPLERVFRQRPAELGLVYQSTGHVRPFVKRFF
jgi:hypothetical protein